MVASSLQRIHGGVGLTRRGWTFAGASVIVFGVAYASSRIELLYVASLLGVLPLAAWVLVRARRPSLHVARSFSPHVVEAGRTSSVVVVVRNRSRRRTPALVWQDLLPWPPGATGEGELPALEPAGARFEGRGNSAALEYEVTPPRRGVVSLGPLVLELSDPFGLATGILQAGGTDELVVTPAVLPLPESGLSVPAGDGEARLVQHRAVGDEDDAMTREYRTGDAMRRVHWRASARHGELKVRQEEQRSLPEARIVVDTSRDGYPDAEGGQSDAFEWVVRMLASVAVHLRRTGFLVTIEETGRQQLGDVSHGRSRTWGDEDFLTGLASLSLTRAQERDAATPRANGPIIALLGEPTDATVERLLHERRPGELAVAFMVRNAGAVDLLEWGLGTPATAPEIAERLHEAGWVVVPVRPGDDLAPAWGAVVAETGRAREHA